MTIDTTQQRHMKEVQGGKTPTTPNRQFMPSWLTMPQAYRYIREVHKLAVPWRTLHHHAHTGRLPTTEWLGTTMVRRTMIDTICREYRREGRYASLLEGF